MIGVEAERVQRALEIIRENSTKSEHPGEKQATIFVLNVDTFNQI
jgi:uncharacterized protein YaaQ